MTEEKSSTVSERNKQEEEAQWASHKAEREVWSPKMVEALERGIKGGKWFSLIDKVYSERTLALAWEKVASNAGASGVDGITVERFAKDSQSRLLAVKEHLRRGDYRAQPIKRVWIPKPGSTEKRPLGIPTVRDRIVQTAMRMVIEPIFEQEFAEQSYGFRPGRSGKEALRRVEELLKAGNVHVVDIDIKGYFDAIPHERLMKLVGERIADGRVMGLIEAFLKAGVMEGMESWEAEDGTPQGGVISPLLANIYLNPLDWIMKQSGMEMVRYADDMVILCREAESAAAALEAVREWMGEAQLQLHPEKTRIVEMTEAGSHFDFLGYRFWRGKDGRIKRFVRPKSVKKLRDRLRPLTKRNSGSRLASVIAKINPVLRGWYGYFKHASRSTMVRTDEWVRGRLRNILRRRSGRANRATGRDHHRWPNRYFETQGLFCLEHAHIADRHTLRKGVTC